ncbi:MULTISPECIES: O-antigen ligase family protein [unclassified Exiguobacterium]|uniref:O-antigen ligase family protein n=1 Tax=unclassified Exiguobacterium TaxID=2644629 RepID=UPI001BE82478|nr:MULTISPECIES: O-antigen ligase family protein [unclassified Exiguobacterium]
MSSKRYLRNIDIVLKKSTIEWIGIWSLFIFSFVNIATLVVSLIILLLLFLKQKEIGAIKVLNIITLRTIINPGLAIDIGSIQTFKWCIIFLCSFYLIFSYRKIDKRSKVKINNILFFVLLFGLYSTVASFITSNLPLVATFKLMSYMIAFIGILVGIYLTHEKFDWLNWISKMFMGVMILSVPLIFNSVGYLRNGHSFQGVTNQPNMLGIILVLFFAVILTRLHLSKVTNDICSYVILGAILYIGSLTESRTSLISMTILLILYVFHLNKNPIKKIISYNIIGFISIIYLMGNDQILMKIKDFLYKGQETILYSRFIQIDGLLSNFVENPLLGSGFAVPVIPFKSYTFSSEYVVEPGNLILSVLSYGGILGLILFINYLIIIFKSSEKKYKQTVFLFISPILISMGEMVFFSTNNIGIWCYMLLSLSIVVGTNLSEGGSGKWK